MTRTETIALIHYHAGQIQQNCNVCFSANEAEWRNAGRDAVDESSRRIAELLTGLKKEPVPAK
jgi:hypothetical protein